MLLIPWHAPDEDTTEFHMIARHEIHLFVQRIPGPLTFLRFDVVPSGVACAHHVNADCGHLRNPPRIILRGTVIDVATADSEWAQAGSARFIRQFTRSSGDYYQN